MTLGAPGFLWAALAASVAVVALHLLAWRRPTPFALPTARFVPATPARAVASRLQLTDALLLALRLLALLLIGLAVAEPRLSPDRSGRGRVIVADRSRGVADVADVTRRIDSLARGVDVARAIWFDSVPHGARPVIASGDSLARRVEARGSLAAALVAATREATRLARTSDSVDIVVVSPLVAEAWDAAVVPVRGAWRGALGVVRVAPRRSAVQPVAASEGPAASGRALDDPVAATMASAGVAAAVRTARLEADGRDSAFARSGGVVLVWPGPPSGDSRSVTVTTGRHASVGSVERADDALASLTGRAIAWDESGETLAREVALGAGCIRHLGFVPASRGDLALRPSLLDVMRDLTGACDARDWSLVSDAALARLVAPYRADAAGHGVPSNVEEAGGSATRWLLVAALVALTLEWWLRRRRARRARASTGDSVPTLDRESAA